MIHKKIIEVAVNNKDVLDIGSVGQTDSYLLWNLYPTSIIKSLIGIDIEEIM